jgi:hypothetical protein
MTQPTVGTESVVSARMYPLTKNSQLFQSSRTLSTLHCHSHSLACILAPLQNNAQFTATAGVWLSTSLAHQANELCTTLRPQTGPQKPLSSAPAVFHKQRGVWETQCLVNPLPAPGAEHLHTPDPILHKQATADSVRAGCKKTPRMCSRHRAVLAVLATSPAPGCGAITTGQHARLQANALPALAVNNPQS